MRKTRIFLATGSLAAITLMGLAPAASAASCIPNAGQSFVAPTFQTTLLTPGTPGSPGSEALTHDEYMLQQEVYSWFAKGEVPEDFTETGEHRVLNYEESGWLDEGTLPEGEGWTKFDTRVVVEDGAWVTYYQYVREVVDTPGTPGSPAEYETQTKTSKSSFIEGWTKVGEEKVVTREAKDAVTHDEHIYQRKVVTTPYQAPVAPTYKDVLVEAGQPAQGYDKYLYQKQVKGEVQTKTWIGWVKSGNFGWETYPGVTEWSDKNVGVLAAGPHSAVISENGNTRKVSTHYQMVNTGTKEFVETKPATEDRYETVIDQPGKDEVQEVSHIETSDWLESAPAGDGWTIIDTKTVEDEAAVAEESHILYTHQRQVETKPEVKPTDPVTHKEYVWVESADELEGEGWEATGEVKRKQGEATYKVQHNYNRFDVEVEAYQTETTDWLTETQAGQLEGDYYLIDQRTVIDQEGWEPIVGTPDIFGQVVTDAGRPFIAPIACAAPVKAEASDEQHDELAVTGSNDNQALILGGGAIGLAALGTILVAARRRTVQD